MDAVTTQAPEPPTQDPKGALGAIGKRARAANLTRAYEIQATLLSAASGHEVSADGREAALRAAHQIAGSAGTFGMARASRMAQDLQMHLERTSLAERHALMPVFAALDSLLQELTPEPGSEAARPQSFARHTMLIAHGDPALATRISIAARARNWDTRWAGDVASVSAELDRTPPDVMLLDLDLDNGGGEALLTEAARHDPPIPAIVLVHDDDFLDRVEAARAGATSFVNAALAPEHIVAAVACTVTRRDSRRGKLLAVDDDPVLLDYLGDLFKDSELDITTVANPLRFWDKMRETQPDLVLLDVDMPGVTGLELCRLIRADAQWAQLPVLVLTGTVHPNNVTSIFSAGADDYVAKPVVGPELVARINNRLDRVRLHRRLAETDHLTGLRNRSAFATAFEELTLRAPQVDQPVCLASIDVDDFRRINIDHGYAVGDEVIQRLAALLDASFRGEDIVGRWAGKEFVVAMLGLTREDGVARIAGILEAFRLETFGSDGALPIRATFSGAVAQLGTDGADLYELQRVLGQTMGATKHVGGDRVLPVGWDPETDPDVTDVLLVEDDEALAAVLQHALTTRGLRGRHVGDGKEVLRLLTGPDRLTARVIVLDVDLPGLNGLDVLARLGSEGVLNRSRVIMLTAHAGESEVLAALRLGAFDHVAKPFSLPVLVQRIRRALAGS
jgi:diguanylate cyclase (GGDEF)-like protein